MSDKTEQPTQKKIRDAREKGQVAKSREIGHSAVMLAIFLFLGATGEFYLDHFKQLISHSADLCKLPFDEALHTLMLSVTTEFVLLSFPVLLVATVAAVLADFFQVGALLSFESVKPDLKKLNPASWFKKTFSKKNLIELIKSILKITFLSLLLYIVIEGSLRALFLLPYTGLESVLSVFSAVLKRIVIYSSMAFITVAAADYFFQKSQHIKDLRMTKQEVKQEYKEMEGDPHIKGKRKQLHRELVTSNMLQNVKKSSVVITNPTELAIALFYDKEKTKLPVIMAKGENLLAKRIIEIAQEEGIPIMRNVPLAHALYEQVDVNQYISSDLIQPVAEVLKWVQQLRRDR